MCENCFERLIYGFDSEKSFNEFEAILQRKISENAIEVIDYNGDEQVISGPSYKCRACCELWSLSVPENGWRGYFLTQEQQIAYKAKIEREEKSGQRGCFVIIAVIVLLLILYFIN